LPELIYDLHTHSDASDGVLTPEKLMEAAHHRGVKTIALTDHDTTSGLTEGRKAADLLGITLIDGVEISATWKGQTIHIVGLAVQVENEVLKRGLQQNLQAREQRATKINERLSNCGIEPMEWAEAGNGIPTRTHFARHLIEVGGAKDIKQAFKRYLAVDKPAWVGVEWLPLVDVVQIIVEAGGIAVIAHPFRYKFTRTRLCALVEEFKMAGGCGIEVISGNTNANQLRDMVSISAQYELLASRGSDFHDPAQIWAPLGGGPEIPGDCTPVWTHWQED
jgi:3',5'-nucleoside bisphosphate phosphatase